MRGINKYNNRPESYRRYVVTLQQGKSAIKRIVSATSERSAIDTARINHGGGIVQSARLATAADLD